MSEFFDDENVISEIRDTEKKGEGPKLKNLLSRKAVDNFELDMIMNEFQE